jgi:hypothetical protein
MAHVYVRAYRTLLAEAQPARGVPVRPVVPRPAVAPTLRAATGAP